MPAKYPSHLYIRVDRALRADLNKAAAAAGLNVSAFARRELRAALNACAAGQPEGGPVIRSPSTQGAA